MDIQNIIVTLLFLGAVYVTIKRVLKTFKRKAVQEPTPRDCDGHNCTDCH